MAQEDAGLALGLSLGGGGDASAAAAHRSNSSRPARWEASSQCPLEPSLTLSMPDDTTLTATASGGGGGHSVSSLSVGGAVKRERVEEAADLGEMVSSTAAAAGAEDDDDGSTRKKLRLTKEQSALLEDRFKEHSTLNPKQKVALANQLNLRPRQVEVWFQNRRARLDEAEADGGGLRVPQALLRDAHRGEPPPAARAAGAPRSQVRPAASALDQHQPTLGSPALPGGPVLHAAAGRHADHLPVLRARHHRRQGRLRQAQGHPPLLQPLHPLRRLLICAPSHVHTDIMSGSSTKLNGGAPLLP
ncbi:unnamed protein product [Alopecurus aequalis]